MKKILFILSVVSFVSCEKSVESNPLNNAETYYPLVYSVSVQGDSAFISWTPKNEYDHGTDTLIGTDSIAWGIIYNNGTEIFLRTTAKSDTGNAKVQMTLYSYAGQKNMTEIASVIDSGSTVNVELTYTVPE
jgi:hypothetical protein